jgi:hypothetical protein
MATDRENNGHTASAYSMGGRIKAYWQSSFDPGNQTSFLTCCTSTFSSTAVFVQTDCVKCTFGLGTFRSNRLFCKLRDRPERNSWELADGLSYHSQHASFDDGTKWTATAVGRMFCMESFPEFSTVCGDLRAWRLLLVLQEYCILCIGAVVLCLCFAV